MSKTLNTPKKSKRKRHNKSKVFQTQFKVTFEGFFKQPQTMKELSVETGIDRANICRYCQVLRKAGKISIYKKKYCSVTNHWANAYTSNPALFTQSSQLELF
jgi:DNA-binding transcriptional regulator LsrR (DeoR family)